MVKIGSWNVCLGLKGKKDYVKSMICEKELDICCIQECEIKPDYPSNMLTFKDYNLEVEINNIKSRCCTYIRNSVNYKRRRDLEGEDNNLIVIEIGDAKKYFIINLYRSFCKQNNVSLMDRFIAQLNLLEKVIQDNPGHDTIIMGDFNLNHSLNHNSNYNYKSFFDKLNELTSNTNLKQIVNFPTWSRVINGQTKESILDHIYIKDVTLITNLTSITPEIGDHKLITFEINSDQPVLKSTIKRDWRFYNKDLLISNLANQNFNMEVNDVQQFWNQMENKIVDVIDILAPRKEFVNNSINNTHHSVKLKPIIHKKRKLLKRFKASKCPNLKTKIEELNSEIKLEIKKSKRMIIRRGLVSGNSKSLWRAVNLAKDINVNEIPVEMKHAGITIQKQNLSESFADFFDEKVKKIVETCEVDHNSYNGKRKVNCADENFMTLKNVSNAMKSIKIKNCEGYDRIPQRVLNEGMEILLQPTQKLFNLIYINKAIPEQWSISKIVPIFKKGSKNEIENYRPIANLCAMTKVYEQLIINRLREIEKNENCDLTGSSQHGFKQKRSTSTAGMTIQSILARALDQDNYALMASIDLSAAFDVVNIELLIKRLKLIGIPKDVVELIKIWLKNRLFYVDIDGDCSFLKTSDTGTIQGSRLGPILYAIFVSPLFDLEKLTNYADDNFIIRWEKVLSKLITSMEKSLEAITKWLKKSGLKVNESKTELCLFHRSSQTKVILKISNNEIKSLDNMNVLGIIFDNKLNWNDHVAKTISKANSALHCIRLIKFYFDPHELLNIITAYFYSILYYGSDIWNIPCLNANLKQRLLSTSAQALKICTPSYHDRMSFLELHRLNNRATPTQMCDYKHALQLYNLIHQEIPKADWVDLNFQQVFGCRVGTFNFTRTNNYKVGLNLMCNRFHNINNRVKYEWMEGGFESYKIKCKNMFLPI